MKHNQETPNQTTLLTRCLHEGSSGHSRSMSGCSGSKQSWDPIQAARWIWLVPWTSCGFLEAGRPPGHHGAQWRCFQNLTHSRDPQTLRPWHLWGLTRHLVQVYLTADTPSPAPRATASPLHCRPSCLQETLFTLMTRPPQPHSKLSFIQTRMSSTTGTFGHMAPEVQPQPTCLERSLMGVTHFVRRGRARAHLHRAQRSESLRTSQRLSSPKMYCVRKHPFFVKY